MGDFVIFCVMFYSARNHVADQYLSWPSEMDDRVVMRIRGQWVLEFIWIVIRLGVDSSVNVCWCAECEHNVKVVS